MTEKKVRKVTPLRLEVREVEQRSQPSYNVNVPNRSANRPPSTPGAGSPFTAKPAG
jgi:hypothetical protein